VKGNLLRSRKLTQHPQT